SAAHDTVSFYSGDPATLVNERLKPAYRNIWMVGGAEVTRDWIRSQLADEIVISIMPIILGAGIPFFDAIGQEFPLHLKDVTAYRDGMVELCYGLIKKHAGE
ncbi:MAG: dihydrofolate reductase family protein, partial [Saprospiraceae bacterium]|nr:dihydrofolate reductase family protein [Saprospiraceae bacterium]